jgi:hypothetical protein
MNDKHDTAMHEIAHAAACAAEAVKIGAFNAWVHMSVFKAPNAKGQAGAFYVEHRDAATARRLMGAASFGPAALMPEPALRTAIRTSKGMTAGLSDEDLKAAEFYKKHFGFPEALVPATWALLNATGDARLKRMASILISSESISIALRDLFPVSRVKQASDQAPAIKFNADLGRHLAGPCPEVRA